MKNKLFTIFAAAAAFVGFANNQLEATSAIPSLLVVQVSTSGLNSIVLSTNTLGMNIDADISSTTIGGIEEQVIGYVEWNATKNATTLQRIKITQIEQWQSTDPGAPATGLFTAQKAKAGGSSDTDALIQMLAIKLYTNVDSTSTSTITYIAPTQLSATNTSGRIWGANMTAATLDTYAGLIGILSFYVVDDMSNSILPGTYICTMQFSIEA